MKNNNKAKKVNNNKKLPKGELVIYRSKDGQAKLEVKLEQETIWLTQAQISQLFGTERSVITKHLRNIFESSELSEKSNVQKMHIANSDKPVKFYNLNCIISVGYRVNSKRATEFRIWATQVLKKYIVNGVVVNKKRLQDKSVDFKSLEGALKVLKNTIESKKLEADEAKGLLQVISDYADSWIILNQYDEGKLKVSQTKIKKIIGIDYLLAQDSIVELKQSLIGRKQASHLFGKERDKGLESILNSINQSFGGKRLYPSIEEKSAHLLYFIIKDHPFVDGNKRIGCLLFILFLQRNKFLLDKKGEKKINNSALVALALLVAESNPKDKEVMIALITSLIRK